MHFEQEIASKVLSNTIATDAKGVPIHPVDYHLAALDLRIIDPLDRSSQEFLALERYAHETHGATHQHFKVQVESIFRIERAGEEERWNNAGYGKRPDGDRMLLWHGSRSTNFAGGQDVLCVRTALLICLCESLGILKQGLRIAPPEAPVSGYVRLYAVSR
jgi:poly [ADP-ribose] polymerase 2/3/4